MVGFFTAVRFNNSLQPPEILVPNRLKPRCAFIVPCFTRDAKFDHQHRFGTALRFAEAYEFAPFIGDPHRQTEVQTDHIVPIRFDRDAVSNGYDIVDSLETWFFHFPPQQNRLNKLHMFFDELPNRELFFLLFASSIVQVRYFFENSGLMLSICLVEGVLFVEESPVRHPSLGVWITFLGHN